MCAARILYDKDTLPNNASGLTRLTNEPGPYRNQRRRNFTGRRSPKSYYERTTTVRFVQPSTGRAVCTKLNRVQRTKARIDNGTCLCENFLRGHCDYGSNCPLAHVPKQYLWEFLTPTVNRDTYTYDKGFNVRCYTPNMDAYYDIPSEWIYVTRGSERYVELYNDNGDNFKEKCKLCEDLQRTGCCQRGGECEDVHCCCADISQFPCIRTHIAEPEAVQRYERLDRGVTVRVFQPNSGVDSQDFAGDDVLRTAGATQYEEAYMREGGVPNVKMQHCAHFQNKKLCRLGDGCRFLHVVSVALATPLQDDEDTMTTPRLSPVLSARMPASPPTVAVPASAAAAAAAAAAASSGATLTGVAMTAAPVVQSRASKNSAAYFAAASLAQGSTGVGGGGGYVHGGGNNSSSSDSNSNMDASIMPSLSGANYSGYEDARRLPMVLNVTTASFADAAAVPPLPSRQPPSVVVGVPFATRAATATVTVGGGVVAAGDRVAAAMTTATAQSGVVSPSLSPSSAVYARAVPVVLNNNNNVSSSNVSSSNNSITALRNSSAVVTRHGVGSILPTARLSPNTSVLRVPIGDPAVLAMAEVIQLPEACSTEAVKGGAVVSPRRNNPYALSP